MHIYEILRNKSLVDHNSARFSIFIKVSVERNDNIVALFALIDLAYSNFPVMVVHSLNRNWFHGPFCLELVEVSSSPGERVSLFGSDVYWSLLEVGLSSVTLVRFLVDLLALILGSEGAVNHGWDGESCECQLFRVHLN